MIDLGINSKLDNKRVTILASLDVEIRKKSRGFISTPVSSVPQLDRQTALATMNGMFEILALQAQTRPFAVGLRLLDDIAPVFRRACPESPGERVNLPNILLNPDFNLRNFAASDIMISVTTGQPTYLQYEVPFSLDLCERMSKAKSENGLQSIYGIPNELIMLFAWINSLCEEPGAGQNLGLVSWIEDNLWKIKIADDQSSDPLLRIGRMAVQECWRFAVIVYLYMALCEADSSDPRVIRAQKGYMRLVRGIKPGRYPDAYLINSMIIVGIAITEERDRETLRQRMYKVWEWMEPGTTGNDAIMRLEDIWTRTRVERRPAVWTDLRIASRKVLGR
ncbi:hypothetical protein BN14_09204 [Rhizoctonia solani AG-1 IB]|uniref:Fungal zn(2)-Cys(6) binuclear cluster domain-containing protein n=1 Tax=Thanatephorus cucumeris (strain AG1-IB / isolate 7/3/14) TaxID=1108050 RepID=M5C7R2_THACB|nr:hypothetical protein BN14_09204 [Rhizoctonia solani AG-1 IB]